MTNPASITVISATNRAESSTEVVAGWYYDLLKIKNQEALFYSLKDLPPDFTFNNDTVGRKNPVFSSIIEKYLISSGKIVFVAPEYNGSIPGVLKSFIDGTEPRIFEGKKAALVGVATGRSGNVRGLDHLTNILNYLEVQVLPFKVPLSGVMNLISDRKITDETAKKSLEKQIDKFIKF